MNIYHKFAEKARRDPRWLDLPLTKAFKMIQEEEKQLEAAQKEIARHEAKLKARD